MSEQERYINSEIEVIMNDRVYQKRLRDIPARFVKQVFTETGIRSIEEQKQYVSEHQKPSKIVNKVRIGKGVAELKGIFSQDELEKDVIRKLFDKRKLQEIVDSMPESKIKGVFG